MKLFFTAILIVSSVSFASVDYVAVGSLIKEGNKKISDTKGLVACMVNYYEVNQNCNSIELLNGKFSKLMDNSTFGIVSFDECSYSIFENPLSIRYSTQDLRRLAQDAKPEDAVWALIERFERSVDTLETEIAAVYRKTKFQETYTSQCLFGVEPEPTSIKDLICK